MTKGIVCIAPFAIAAVLALDPAGAGTFTVLHSSCIYCADKDEFPVSLVSDSSGNLYGAASRSVFELRRNGDGSFEYKHLAKFHDGRKSPTGYALGSLIIDVAGNLYGTATFGGHQHGLVFELLPSKEGKTWTEKVLYTFCPGAGCSDGAEPAALTYAGASNGAPYDGASPLIGVTAGDPRGDPAGNVFMLRKRAGLWQEKVLYHFCSLPNCRDGWDPHAIAIDSVGNLFGTTYHGGLSRHIGSAGTVFELSPTGTNWTFTTLHEFCSMPKCSDGASPWGLAIDADGSLVGVATSGGSCWRSRYGCGAIYRLIPAGQTSQETILYSFCALAKCMDGFRPLSISIDSSGDVFGTTQWGGGNNIDDKLGGGVAFELSGGTLSILHSFCSFADCADGEYPDSMSFQSGSQALFGTAVRGGTNNAGTIFEISPLRAWQTR